MDIPQNAWEIIELQLAKIQHGTISLIVQDGCLIQLDKTEKVRLNSLVAAKRENTADNPGARAGQDQLRRRLCEELSGLRFGQVVIVIKEGKVVQIERLEKHRVTGLEGLFGEGI